MVEAPVADRGERSGVDGASSQPHIREVADPTDLRALAGLFQQIWRTGPAFAPVSPDVLRAVAFSGGYVAAAYLGADLVGGSAGFLMPAETRALHSHIAGVRPALQGRRLGLALKLHQRDWALRHGLDTITWTADPLVRRNGYFNLARLGAIGTAYLIDFYGAMTDPVNAGDPSDRLAMRWQLDQPAPAGPPGSAGGGLDPDVAVILDESADRGPCRRQGRGDRLACFVPADIEALRVRHPALASRWRYAVREALSGRLGDGGYRLTGMTGDGYYLLDRHR